MKLSGMVKLLFGIGSVFCFLIIAYNALYTPYQQEMTYKKDTIIVDSSSQDDGQARVSQEVKQEDEAKQEEEIPNQQNESYPSQSEENTSKEDPNYTYELKNNSKQSDSNSKTNHSNNQSSKGSNEIQEPVRFNINTATIQQLCAIKGIGEVTAGKIIAYRDDIGGFDSVERVMDIKGIGQATYEKIAEYAYVK